MQVLPALIQKFRLIIGIIIAFYVVLSIKTWNPDTMGHCPFTALIVSLLGITSFKAIASGKVM
jgi:hypothetical protein